MIKDDLTIWQIFSSNCRRPHEVVRDCIKSWNSYCTHMFCWLNGKYSIDEYVFSLIRLNCTANMYSILSHQKRPGAYKIRETPLQMAYALAEYGDIGLKKPDVIMQFDDDEMIPQHPDFDDYFDEWLESDSPLMNMNWVYLWGDRETIRVDKFASQKSHGFFFKTDKHLIGREPFTWLPYGGGGRPSYLPRSCGWECPYPVLHFSHMTRKMRQQYTEDEKTGEQIKRDEHSRKKHYQIDPPSTYYTMPFNRNITMSRILNIQKNILLLNPPPICTKHNPKKE